MARNVLQKLTIYIIFIFSAGQLYGSEPYTEEIVKHIQNNFNIKHQVWGIETNQANGFVYMATNAGLIEFDGISFTAQQSNKNKALRSIFIDTTGVIFTGGFENFGYWQYESNCNLVYHSLADSSDINKNDEIWRIYELNGILYFQSFTTIYRYQNNIITKIPVPGFMLFMFKTNNKFMVQVLDRGLYSVNDTVFSFIETSEQFKNIKIHAIVPYNNKNLLICTEKNGIYFYDGNKFTFWNTPISNQLIQKTCNAAKQINDTTFVFGSILDGVVFTNKKGEVISHYNFSNGLNNNTVLSISNSISGSVWVGLDEGANYLNQNSSISYFKAKTGSLGTLYALYMKDNVIYLGSNHGLFKSEVKEVGQNLIFSELTLVPNSKGQVWTIGEFDNNIICGHNDGTFRVTDKGLVVISDITGGWFIKPYGEYLLEGTYTGLVLFNKDRFGNWEFKNRLEGFYEPTKHFEIDHLGYVWVSHPQKGVFKLTVNEKRDSIENILSYTEYSSRYALNDVYKLNNRIVFSSDKEFFTYDYVNDSIVPLENLNNGLGNYKQASQIIQYENNLYWFIHENAVGLFRISIESVPTLISEYIITDASMSGQAIAMIPVNNKYFLMTNRNGLAQLKNVGKNNQYQAQTLSIKNAFFYGKKESQTICCNTEFKVPYSQNNVIINFADPSAINVSANEYKYRIKEIDESWVATEKPEIRYYNLNPGTYTLEITANSGTVTLTQKITVKKPWYETLAAFFGYFLIVILLSGYFLSYFKNKLKKQRELLEFEVKQTTLENRLQNTNVELMLTLRYLIQKNESLQNLQTEINKVKEKPRDIPIKFIKTLDTHINQGLDLQTREWKMALNNLKLSQEGYFKRLKEKHPKLTNHDIRLCSYLRMNFTSKEIAHLLNISTRAVEISRYRLRKKLDLDHNVNLTDFFMQDEL